MSDRTNPYVPEQTMAQGAPPTGVPVENPTGTLAAPVDYKPAASTRTAEFTALADDSTSANMAGRYELLRALAKGGMGQVHVARDTELERDVALKEIQPRFRLDDASLHRFMLEARVTGRLEHPGVVPVYGLGTYPDGRPYYAMRFITGRSFQDAIEEFHTADGPGRDPQERTFALRQLLRRFIDVCNTMAYAHSRGILHRDIKPANVMLGNYGETLVVDWGLAKDMAEIKDLDVLPSIPETVMEGFEETKEGYTFQGVTMGTPAYMSPEQAAGKWDITGVASDVYSLGAMLYVLLSGTPPYSGPSYEVITKVQKGEYKPVKLVKGSVPAPLDAIVHKAMAFDIANRYATGLELAHDVECWLADEPISCYREPFSVRAMRWAKRHRTGVITAAVVLLGGSLALGIGLIAVNAEKQRTEQQRQNAVASRDRERQALVTLTDDAIGEMLAGSAKPTPQQIKFLEGLIGMYRGFIEKESDSPDMRLFTAAAHYRIARIDARLGRTDDADTEYTAAAKAFDDHSLTGPDAEKLHGEVDLYRGIMEMQLSRPGAMQSLQDAVNRFDALVKRDPKPDFRYRLAQSRDRLGVQVLRTGDATGAKELLEKALETRKQLLAESPDDAEYQFRVIQSLRQVATADFALGRRTEALATATDAAKRAEELVAKNPTSANYLAMLSELHTLLADQHAKAKAPDTSLVHAKLAATAAGRLAAINPGDFNARRVQAGANINVAQLLRDSGRDAAAAVAVQLAVDILSDLVRDDPSDPLTQSQWLIARTLRMHFGAAKNDKASLKKALPEANAIVAEALALEKKNPGNREVQDALAGALVFQAFAETADGKTKEAYVSLFEAWPRVQANPARTIRHYITALTYWMGETEKFEDVAEAERIAALPMRGGVNHIEAAALYSESAAQVQKATKLSEKERDALALQFIRNATRQLQLAQQAGYRNADAIAKDSMFNAVRDTSAYTEVLEAMRK